ncbi:MAG: DUF1214 domain-containing protein [Rhodospirillaceae bacterium]|nr:MAG: DUF1214 domain-containing protein [Rhodospirillaceae bacterium]
MTGKPPYISTAMEQAWQAYLQGLEDVRQIIFGHRFAEGSRESNEAHYLFHQVQAEAFNVAIAPRPDYPHFRTLYDPLTYTWGVPNVDFLYSVAYLDGRRTYRIWGKRSNSLMVLMQSMNAHLTLPQERIKLLSNRDLDTLQFDKDGNFEIIASATQHDGNWFKLDPESDRNAIMVREVFGDWENERRTEMHVEAIDDVAPRPMVHDETTMIRRLEDAVRFMKYCADGVSIKVVEGALAMAGGWNRFAVPKLGAGQAAAPEATYNILAYDIGPEDALIVEIDPPNPKYWGVQLSDIWSQAIDYTYHNCSLNKAQASVDGDGKIRAVICHRDPGIQNWLTPVDSRKGAVFVRYFFAQGISTPIARLVPYAELAQNLPEDTARIAPEVRRAELKKRRRAIERRYNY